MEENNNSNMGQTPDLQSGKKTNKVAVGIVAVVCIALVAIAGVLVKTMGNPLSGTPQQIVMKAYNNSCEKVEKENDEQSKINGYTVVQAISQSDAYEVNGNVRLEGMTGEDATLASAMMQGFGFSVNVKQTQDLNKILGSIALTKGDTTLVNLDMFKDGQQLNLDVPQVFPTPYKMNLDTFKDDFNASDLKKVMGYEASLNDEKIIEAYKEYGEAIKKIDRQDSIKKFLNEYRALNKDFIKESQLKEVEAKTLKIDDKDIKCKVYEASYKKDEIKKYITGVMDVCLEQEISQAYLELMESIESTSGGTEDFSKENIKAKLNEALDELDDNEVKMQYVIRDKYLVQTILIIPNKDDEKEQIEVTFSNLGDKFLTDLCQCQFEYKSGDNVAKFTLQYKANYGQKSDDLKQEISFVYEDSELEDHVEMNHNWVYNKKDNAFSFNTQFVTDDENEITLEGKGTKVVNAAQKSMEYKLDTINASLNTNGTKQSIQLSAAYSAKAIKESDIQGDFANAKEILKMSYDELKKDAQEMQNNLQGLVGVFY